MAQIVKPNGHIYTYDINKKFLSAAKKNVKKANANDVVKFINKDAREGFKQLNVDAVMLDLADPWNVVPYAYNSLKGGNPLASFSPTINQVEKTVSALKENGFINIESIECFMREMHIEEGRSRPISRMIAHTGYLTFANKIYCI
jgi:tRNA (adenine57-N1/adenine58-N1)-methyltransferase